MPGSRTEPFVAGEYYHVFNRGIDKRVIFTQPYDFERFMMLLYVCNATNQITLDSLIRFQNKTFQQVFQEQKTGKLVSIGAWCLMDNHFHLLLKEESEKGITKFMKKLGTGYSMYFNAKHERSGALFGGRFKSVHIKDDAHLRHLFGYVHLNPLDLRFPKWKDTVDQYSEKEMTDFLTNYRYSSYREHAGVSRTEQVIVTSDAFPQYFSKPNSFVEFLNCYYTPLKQ